MSFIALNKSILTNINVAHQQMHSLSNFLILWDCAQGHRGVCVSWTKESFEGWGQFSRWSEVVQCTKGLQNVLPQGFCF